MPRGHVRILRGNLRWPTSLVNLPPSGGYPFESCLLVLVQSDLLHCAETGSVLHKLLERTLRLHTG